MTRFVLKPSIQSRVSKCILSFTGINHNILPTFGKKINIESIFTDFEKRRKFSSKVSTE